MSGLSHTDMSDDVRRPPTLLDSMVLVAAIACAIVACERLARQPEMRSLGRWPSVLLCSPLAVLAISASLLAVRLRPPRPARTILWSQPGFVASFAAVCAGLIALVTQAARHYPIVLQSKSAWHDHLFLIIAVEIPVAINYAVAIAWASLFLSGQWRAEPTLLDRLGRLVGVYWLAIPLVTIAAGWRPFFCVW